MDTHEMTYQTTAQPPAECKVTNFDPWPHFGQQVLYNSCEHLGFFEDLAKEKMKAQHTELFTWYLAFTLNILLMLYCSLIYSTFFFYGNQFSFMETVIQ